MIGDLDLLGTNVNIIISDTKSMNHSENVSKPAMGKRAATKKQTYIEGFKHTTSSCNTISELTLA